VRRLCSLLALGLAATAACAQEASWHLTLQLYSLHENTTRADLTDKTPGIGVLRRSPEHWLAGAGVFRNSLGRTAGYGYVGKQWPLGPVYVGGIGGLTHNYDYNDRGIAPLGAAVVTVPWAENWALELAGIPRIRDYTYTTLNFTVSWRFR
jgi:hypothetical protein